ncbi:CASP-like protein 1U2 [Lolium perenne]|uniref:CASP-like protein 1U2 n=1 Tax=Lolium perenne TaxID=4522 RepID=UPI0021EB228C|nr:CASP-like protein 1U2 [Lolium perenne]
MMQGPEAPAAQWWPSWHHHRDDPPPPPPNGSKSVNFLLRLSALILALASAMVMAASSDCTPSSGVAAFTYTRFGAFVLLVGCNITVTILEAAAIYLQLSLDLAAAAAPPDDDKTVATDLEEEEKGITPAGIVLVVVDLLVPALLYSAMAATYAVAAVFSDQIGACPNFARKVVQAKILSLAACAAITLAAVARAVPLPFNVPPVL